jgi:hypothetical protein
MALYKNGNALQHSTHQAFDEELGPGTQAPNPGIYRCVNCGDEIGIAKGHTLPPQNHHQHSNNLPIKWKLLVCAIQK